MKIVISTHLDTNFTKRKEGVILSYIKPKTMTWGASADLDVDHYQVWSDFINYISQGKELPHERGSNNGIFTLLARKFLLHSHTQ